jgi:hypothetical protein
MASDELTTITSELIEAGRSERGGWNKSQLALLGVSWPPQRGWKVRVVGRPIPKEDADWFVKLGGGSASGPSLF